MTRIGQPIRRIEPAKIPTEKEAPAPTPAPEPVKEPAKEPVPA